MTEWTEDRLAAIRRGEDDEGWWQALARRVAVDYDGTLHPYSKGWTGSEPDDEPPIPGAEDFLLGLLADGYEVVIFSTRADHPEGREGIIRWFGKHMRSVFYAMRDDGTVRVTHEKPAAVAYVDDRAVPFVNGDYTAARAEVDRLAAGRPHGAAPAPPGAEHA